MLVLEFLRLLFH